MGISNLTLVKIASLGGILTVGMGMAFRWKVNENVCNTEHYSEAFKIVRGHQGAVHVLGEPIKDYLFDVANTEKNYTNDLSAHYEVPVGGSKTRGTVHFWADRKETSDSWNVNRIELELRDDATKRLLIKNELSN